VHLSDRTTGVFLMALGAAAAYGGSRLPAVPGQDVGPAAFPMVIGSGLAICGTLVALGIGQSFEAPPEEDAPHTSHLFGLRALVPPALLLFYVLAVDTLGFLLTAAAMVLALALTLGARPRLAVPIALVAPALVHLVFYKLLRVPLPTGWLAAPWA